MENPIRRQYTKYTNEEDRRKGLLEAFLRYSTKPWTCDICDKTILKGNKSNHLKSKKHYQKMIAKYGF
jgi:ribosomal protein L37AE/L43A